VEAEVEDTQDERTPFKVLGVKLGTYDSWDQVDDLTLVFYDVKIDEGVNLPEGVITVNYEDGNFYMYDDNGNETLKRSIISVVGSL
jgi:hypothetical protein